MISTFAIKLEHVEDDEVMQKKVELNGITKIMQEYIDKYSNYIYYHWVQQLSLLKGSFILSMPLLAHFLLFQHDTTCNKFSLHAHP